MGIQNMMDTVLRRFVIDGNGVLLQYKGKASHVVIPDKVITIGESAFAGNDFLESVTIPETVRIIANKAFQRCGRLEEVKFSKSLRSIGSSAFEHCTSLLRMELPSDCYFIGKNAFRGCSSLAQIILSKSLITIESDAFLGCTALTGITIPDSVREIHSGVFQQCTSLRRAILPKWLTIIPDMLFMECKSLEQIMLPDRVADIGTEAFRNCTALETITFSGELTNIGQNAFRNCHELHKIDLPAGVEKIGTSAFSCCIGLKKAVFRKGLSTIGFGAFEGCKALQDVTLPEGLEKIEDHAFWGCSSLETLCIPESVKEFGDNCFTGTAWLCGHPDDLVVAGDGVLLEYRGHARRLELPAYVKAVHTHAFPAGHTPKTLIVPETAVHLGWKFIPGLELVFRRKGHSVTLTLYDNYTISGQDEKRMLEFWEARNIFQKYRHFRAIHDPVYKFPLAVLMFLSEPEDEYYNDYVQRNAKDILKNLIDRNDIENLEKFLALGFVNTDNIDELLNYAIANAQKTGRMEPQIVLIDYKSGKIGYSDIADIIGNAFEL